MRYIFLLLLVAVILLGCEGGGLTAPLGWEGGTDPSLPLHVDAKPAQ